MRTDYDAMAERYDRGRAFSLRQLDGWRRAVLPYVPTGDTVPLVDVGSGTGIWAHSFAGWFDLRVVGVEPSRGMRAQAAVKRLHQHIRYVGGRAEALPLRDESAGAAWLSTMVHHVGDLEAAATELRRVLRPGAPVLIREGFSGRTDGIPWLRYIPEALAITDGFWPTVDTVVDTFAHAGFAAESLRPVEQVTARDLHEYADRLHVRADSTLIQLSDEVFTRAMSRLRQAAASWPAGRPVTTTLDLLVLR